MTQLQRLELLKALSTIRAGCVQHLYIGHSLIPYDILTAVLEAESTGVELTVKELFIKLPYSIMGVRYHLKKLTLEQWIETIPSNGDGRVKLVKSKNKLNSQFDLLGHQLKSVLKISD